MIPSGAPDAPAGQPTALGIAGTPTSPLFTSAFSYDTDQRLTESQATLNGQGSPFYDLKLGYDAASNVLSLSTTLPTAGSTAGGTDSQSFCYDEFARLVWAGTSGTPTGPAAGSCGPTPSGTTLSGAGYTAAYGYDTLDRLTTGPAGSYTYGDSAHLDGVTSTGDGHSYAYDQAGDATCRAPSSSTTCAGTPTGAALSYDAEGRLSGWQNAPGGATTDSFLYDGSGARIEQQTATNSTPSSTSVYVGALAEYDTSGGTTTTTDYLSFAGKLVATHDSAWHYLLSDQLGTPQVQVGASGTAEALQLKAPYGATRYAASSLAHLGFTGQRQDATPNLTYFQARYYDQDVGAFLSADTVAAGGLNRYAYVHGNPETLADPTGHRECYDTCDGHGSGSGSSGAHSDGTPTVANVAKPLSPALLAGCVATPLVCAGFVAAILATYANALTETLLMTLLGFATGIKFLPYLLAEGSIWHDSFIIWAPGQAGYNLSTGTIILNPDLFTQGNTGSANDRLDGLVNATNALVHEAVESFYANAYGIRGNASFSMDYVADRYAGTVTNELEFKLGLRNGPAASNAASESFQDWYNDGGSTQYGPSAGGPGDDAHQWELTNAFTRAVAYLESEPYLLVYDSMGLTLSMLH